MTFIANNDSDANVPETDTNQTEFDAVMHELQQAIQAMHPNDKGRGPEIVDEDYYVRNEYGTAEDYNHSLQDLVRAIRPVIDTIAQITENDDFTKYSCANQFVSQLVKCPSHLWEPTAEALDTKAGILKSWTHTLLDEMNEKRIPRVKASIMTERDHGRSFLQDKEKFLRYTPDGRFHRYRNGVYSLYDENELIIDINNHVSGKSIKRTGIYPKRSRVNEVRETLWKEPGVYLNDVNRLDRSGLLNLQNGMLDVSGDAPKLLRHSPKYLSTVQFSYDYDPEAECPRFERFLSEIFPGENYSGVVSFIKEFFGYCLFPETKHQIFLLLTGNGANGKSKLMEVLRALVGAENCSYLSLKALTSTFRAQMIQDKLVNIGTENDHQKITNTSMLKQISGGEEEIVVEQKFKDPVAILPFVRLIFSTNQLLRFSDTSYGLRRRMRVVPFPQKFEGQDRDLDVLSGIIPEELSGIFNWALEGYYQLRERGYFEEPAIIADATDKVMQFSSPVLQFVKSECDTEDNSYRAGRRELHEAYVKFCKTERHTIIGPRVFLDELKRTVPSIHDTGNQSRLTHDGKPDRILTGIRLRPDEDIHDTVPLEDSASEQTYEFAEHIRTGGHPGVD